MCASSCETPGTVTVTLQPVVTLLTREANSVSNRVVIKYKFYKMNLVNDDRV